MTRKLSKVQLKFINPKCVLEWPLEIIASCIQCLYFMLHVLYVGVSIIGMSIIGMSVIGMSIIGMPKIGVSNIGMP